MTTVPSLVPAAARPIWTALDTPTAPPGQRFAPEGVEHRPEPVSRWLRQAITPGTSVRRGVRLDMRGEIRLGQWRPFTAAQIISATGFVWAAEVGRAPVRIRGFDRYARGEGEMRWKLLGLIPVMSSRGPDTSRSAAGRHAAEALSLVPGRALDNDVAWEAVDDQHAVAVIESDGLRHRVTFEVDEEGRLRSVTLPRWGNPDRGVFAEHVFGAELRGEQVFDGYTLPAELRAGWWYGTDRWAEGEFFRCTIDHAEFF